jgi:hypothetical protein
MVALGSPPAGHYTYPAEGGCSLITDPNKPLLDAAAYAVSDKGELRRDWQQGVYTPRSQAAMGWIGSKQIELTDAARFLNCS